MARARPRRGAGALALPGLNVGPGGAACSAGRLERDPYQQRLTPRSVVVCWRSAEPAIGVAHVGFSFGLLTIDRAMDLVGIAIDGGVAGATLLALTWVPTVLRGPDCRRHPRRTEDEVRVVAEPQAA